MNSKPTSVLELLATETHQNCSYCSAEEGSVEAWLQSQQITPQHYQLLLDRGWRRIGYFICKPIPDEACCRQYAIRSDALKYKLSKSHKRVLKRMKEFLKTEGDEKMRIWTSRDRYPPMPGRKSPQKDTVGDESNQIELPNEVNDSKKIDTSRSASEHASSVVDDVKPTTTKVVKPIPRKGLGADPSKPPCIKAKIRKRETGKGKKMSAPSNATDSYNTLRSLIPHLNPSNDFKRKLEVVLVPALDSDPHFIKTAQESFSIFVKFQSKVLKEPGNEWSFQKWSQCFIDCGISHDRSGTGPGYGNFHQQYILDGKIIAVGVITLIPTALVTEYFYYDPDYGFLTLGTYSALNEICFMNELHRMDNRLKRYYMGAYTYTSPKMRYKLQFSPAELLCPHTYKWIPVQECLSFLKSGRPRLNPKSEEEEPSENETVKKEFDMDMLAVSYQWDDMTYHDYVRKQYEAIDFSKERTEIDEIQEECHAYQMNEMTEEKEALDEYVALVGPECATSLHLKVPVTLYPL